MTLYTYLGKESKLFAERESGLNILWKEVQWDEGYGRLFE